MKKKFINIVLLIVVVILWSRIGIDLGQIKTTPNSKPYGGVNILDSLEFASLDRFVYRSTYRDIFSAVETNTPLVKPNSFIRKPQRPKIRMKLLGVIGDSKQPIAILENGDITEYVSVGDSTLSGMVTSITPDSIVISRKVGDSEILYLRR